MHQRIGLPQSVCLSDSITLPVDHGAVGIDHGGSLQAYMMSTGEEEEEEYVGLVVIR